MEPTLPLPLGGIMEQSAPTRAAAADGVPLGLVGLVMLLGLGVGLGLRLTLITGPAPPVGVAGVGGDLPQATAAKAMHVTNATLAANAAHRTCVLRREFSRI
jgi:hypothetical protein